MKNLLPQSVFLVRSYRALLLAAIAQVLPGTVHGADPLLTIDASHPLHEVSPMLYGLMTEEINRSYDGGLYAELIQNRILKDAPDNPVHWSVIQAAEGNASISLDQNQPINAALTTCLKLETKGEGGVANDGFWGIPVKPQTTYRASFYAKAQKPSSGPLTIRIESNDGTTVFAKARVPQITTQWKRYEVELATNPEVKASQNNRFVIATSGPGTFWFNLVSLFPPTFNGRPNGNRVDLMQLLGEMQPKFLRLPGGNYLEGDHIDTRFKWKETLGDLSQRPGHPGCWRYRSSDGMGLLEFLEWCEDLKVEPVLAVYGGYSLKGEHVKPGPDLKPYVEEALEEIEYVTGDTHTKWGAQRAKDGHPNPFKLTYVEIGNEDGFDRSGSYEGRFVQFYDAIKAKYPTLKLISTVGGEDPVARKFKVQARRPDVLDEHYYRSAREMEDDANHYDQYDRKGPKIFVGEWATREGAPTTNLNAALGDAAWMTGMERNSDIVAISCYAPLFVNVNRGGMQWPSNLIGYDALSSYGSPSYHAQKMFSQYLGDKVLPVNGEQIPTLTWQPPTPKGAATPPMPKQLPSLFYVATRNSKTGTIYLKIVNTAPTEQTVQFAIKGASVSSEGTWVVLASSRPQDTNTITQPNNVVPKTSKISGLGNQFSRALPPYSINVLKLETR